MSNATKVDVLGYLLNSTAFPGAWTSVLNAALHTASPGDAGTQSTSECSYSGYARVAFTRANTSQWTAPNGTGASSNVSLFSFPQRLDGGAAQVAVELSLGLASGQIIARGALSPSISIVLNTVPTFAAGVVVVQAV